MPQTNPYQSPTTLSEPGLGPAPGEGVWRDGMLLVMSKGAVAPPRFVRCNAPTESRIKRQLSWHAPAWYVLLPISPLVYVIVALVIRKTATIHVGYCDLHRRKRRRALMLAWSLVAVGLGLMVYAGSLRTPQTLNIFGGLGLVLAGVVYGIAAAGVAYVKQIDSRFVWLRRISPEYLAELPTFGVGRAP